MNHIDTMKLALEALEEIHPGNMTPMAEKAWNKAITALREALAEQPAQQEPVALLNAIRAEPTEMIHKWRVIDIIQSFPPQGIYYTPPASKPWVGLTNKDIDIAFDDTQEGGGFDDFARAIEAKLKEKNA